MTVSSSALVLALCRCQAHWQELLRGSRWHVRVGRRLQSWRAAGWPMPWQQPRQVLRAQRCVKLLCATVPALTPSSFQGNLSRKSLHFRPMLAALAADVWDTAGQLVFIRCLIQVLLHLTQSCAVQNLWASRSGTNHLLAPHCNAKPNKHVGLLLCRNQAAFSPCWRRVLHWRQMWLRRRLPLAR